MIKSNSKIKKIANWHYLGHFFDIMMKQMTDGFGIGNRKERGMICKNKFFILSSNIAIRKFIPNMNKFENW